MKLILKQRGSRAALRTGPRNETAQQRFVGGSMGPLPVAGSISPDVNDPAFRAVCSISCARLTSIKRKRCWKAVSILSSLKPFLTRSMERPRCLLLVTHS